jgi:hypothetical protein
MVTTTLEIKPEFGYVLATAIVTGFHCTLQGFSVAAIRYKAATPEYFAKHFPEENDAHKKEFGCGIVKGGHPDNGLGRLFSKLDFITWIKLQNAQRGHLNYLESLPSLLTNLLAAGLFYPLTATALGWTSIVGRQLYTRGYLKKGPDGRGPGFGMAFFSNLGLMGLGIHGALKMSGLFAGK